MRLFPLEHQLRHFAFRRATPKYPATSLPARSFASGYTFDTAKKERQTGQSKAVVDEVASFMESKKKGEAVMSELTLLITMPEQRT